MISGIVAEKLWGKLRPELSGAAAGHFHDGLKLPQGCGLIVVD
jgi:hypothetical protein